SRNLYDRGDQGMGRRDYGNSENRLGAANYDRYGDHGRYRSNMGRSYGRSDFGDRNYGGFENDRNYGRGNQRSYGRGDSEDRSWWDRATDEVSSWFGDEDAERRRSMDRNHRGKGPRNYTRSDDRIKEDINDRLSDDPFIDASDI